jgi:membrane protease YdiL (CAAX protease family)
MQQDSIDQADLNSQTTATAPNAQTTAQPEKLLAPVWHTVLIVALVAAASIAGARNSKQLPALSHHADKYGHLWTYVASIALEWTLAALTLWGLRLRKTSLRSVLGPNAPGIREWFVDAGVAAVFWIVALIFLGTIATLLKPLHLHPENIRDTVSKLAPASALDIGAWTILCISAGICEEFIFRGYLQLQFERLSHRLWIGVLASSAVFGLSHGYEGLSGMLLIIAFGALFSVLRLLRGNTRAGMIAHAWHDFFSGIVLYALAHHKLLS